MGRYKTGHSYTGGVPLGQDIKKSTVTDTKTGEKGEGYAWDHESFKKADDKAWKDLQEKNSKK